MKKREDKVSEPCDDRSAFLENELRKSESKWRSVLEHAPQIGVSLDPQGNILFANRHFLDLTGWELDEIHGRSWFDLFLPEDVRDAVRDVFIQTMQRRDVGDHSRYQNRIVTRDGRVREVSWFNVLTQDAEGCILDVTSMGVDLTAEEEARAALRKSEERLLLALEAAKDAVWEWNPETGETFFSPQWFTMLGYEPGDMPCVYATWKELVHEDDIQAAEETIRNALGTEDDFEFEIRMHANSGEWKWILSRGRVLVSETGKRRVVGTHSGIHERKQAELALKEAKEATEAANSALRLNMAYLNTLVETIPDLVWVKNEKGVYVSCNQRFERLFGATEPEIVGKDDYDFVDKELADHFRRHDKAAIAKGGPSVNEERVTYADDGHVEEVETIKTPMFDDQGKLVGVLGIARDITRRKRIADELKESELRFKALHNASFSGIAIHHDRIILDCNQGLADITGYTMDELVGMDGLLLFAESCRETVDQMARSGSEEPYEAIGVRKNGEEYHLRLMGRNIPYKGEEVRAVEFRDISPRKKAEEQLRDSELRHRVIFEKSPLGMVRFGKDGSILDCNERFAEQMGADRGALLGLKTLENCTELLRGPLEQALNGAPASFEDYYTSVVGGKTSYLHVQFNPVNIGQGPTEVIATSEDFSERKEARDELQKAKDEAEAFSRSKTEFLTNMSHEIRTPLNGILGMLQLLQGSDLSPEQAEYITDAIQSSKRLTNLLTDILDLSRVEAGKLMVRKAPFEIGETCKQVFDLYRLTSDQSGVELRCNFDPAIPGILIGDAVRLQQVLTNLLGNAFKFTPSGHIDLTARLLPYSTAEQCRVLFCVSDTGKGIPDDKLATLFDAFTQVSEGYTRPHQGAGLGLAICKQLVGLMGGSIDVSSEEGVGTAIYVSLPFAVSEEAFVPEAAPTRREKSRQGRNLKILLAEDERVNSLVTRRLLEKAGHTVTVVENGREAVDAARAERFDVILMDIQMPVMDGVSATRAIRAGEAGVQAAKTPIAAVTAYAMVGDREKFLEAGMDGYVVKPMELDKLKVFLDSI